MIEPHMIPPPAGEPAQPETSRALELGASTGWAEWAVSVVLVHHKTDGGINVMNELQRVRARSQDEAKGTAMRVSMSRLPEHLIHVITALKIADVPNAPISRTTGTGDTAR
jgi:hypothetical protein